MMTSQDRNSAPEAEETEVEWTKEDSINYVAALKRELISILRDPKGITVADIASPQTRKLIMRVFELRKELIASLEGVASKGEA